MWLDGLFLVRTWMYTEINSQTQGTFLWIGKLCAFALCFDVIFVEFILCLLWKSLQCVLFYAEIDVVCDEITLASFFKSSLSTQIYCGNLGTLFDGDRWFGGQHSKFSTFSGLWCRYVKILLWIEMLLCVFMF